GPTALMGDSVAPVESLAIEIRQGSEGTRREKAPAGILNRALHAALFIAPGGAAGPGGGVVVGGEFQEAGMEVDGIAVALQDYAAEIVGLWWRSPFCVRRPGSSPACWAASVPRAT